MAGAGYKLYATGDVLSATDVNSYLQQQTVMVFASAAARTSALSLVLAEGMISYLIDTDAVEVYNGSAWVGVANAGDITGVTAGTGISGGGTSGTVTVTNSMATAIDAKGDLIGGTGADTFSRLAVGANGTILTADSAEATGLKWATPAGGGGQTLISTNTLSSTSTTISIPSGYKDIIIKTNNWTISGAQQWRVRLNSNTSSVYGWAGVNRQGGTAYLVGGTLTDWESSGTGISGGNIQMQMCIYDYLATNTRLGTMNAAYTITGSSAAANENWTLSFLDSTAITSVTLSGLSGGTLSGTCYIIGVN